MFKTTLLACIVLGVGLLVVASEDIQLPHLKREDIIQVIEEVENADDKLDVVVAEADPDDFDSMETEGEADSDAVLTSSGAGEPARESEEAAGAWPASTGMDFTFGADNKLNLLRFFHGSYYHRQYNRINDYLVDATNSTSYEVNMRLAREWLQRERDSGVNLFKNKATVEALEQFTALTSIEGKCDRYSYAIVWRNDQATGGEAHKRSSKISQSPRRIITLVHYASLSHAIGCHHVYPENFRQIRQKADLQTLDKVETFLNAIINDHLGSKNSLASLFNNKIDVSIDATRIVSGIKSIKGKKAAQLAYHTIQGHSVNDENRVYLRKVVDEKKGARIVNQEKVRELVKAYLVEPCKYYLETFGPDVYIPAMYEARMLEPVDRYSSLEGELLDGFIYGWIRYRLCESLVNKDQNSLAKDVISFINKLPDQ